MPRSVRKRNQKLELLTHIDKKWALSTRKVGTFDTLSTRNAYSCKGFRHLQKIYKRLQKILISLVFPSFSKNKFFKKKQKIKNQNKTIFGFYVQTGPNLLKGIFKAFKKKSHVNMTVQTGWTLSDDYPQCCFSFQQLWRLDRSECFRGKREKEKFRKKKNREASTAGGCM